MSIAYLLVALLLPVLHKMLRPAWRALALVALLLHIFPLDPSALPVVRIDGKGEELVEAWQSASGTVAVTPIVIAQTGDQRLYRRIAGCLGGNVQAP